MIARQRLNIFLLHGGKVLLWILIRGNPRGEHVSAVTDYAFVTAVLVFPLAIRNRGIRASMPNASVGRWSLAGYGCLTRATDWGRTRQRISFRGARVQHLLLLLWLMLLVMLLRLMLNLYLLHLLLLHLRKYRKTVRFTGTTVASKLSLTCASTPVYPCTPVCARASKRGRQR